MKIFSLVIALGFLVLETGSLCAADIYVATTGNARDFYLRGDGHVVKDSYFNGSAVGVIGASGTNMLIKNNVIRDLKTSSPLHPIAV